MEWDREAQEMLEMVPLEFRAQAVAGTEGYAQKHHYPRVTTSVVEAYKRELGF